MFRLFIAGLAIAMLQPGCVVRYQNRRTPESVPLPRTVDALMQAAELGDKQAQFDLGMRFERGDGVPKDIAHAIRLYRQAASDLGGRRLIFVPQANGTLSAIPTSLGRQKVGLADAKNRLKFLEKLSRRGAE